MLPQSEKDDRHNLDSIVEYHTSTRNINTTIALRSDISTHPIVKPWLYWLAADVISQWRSLPIEEESFATIFQEVNPKINSDSSPLLSALTISKENQNSIASIDLKYKEICQRNNTTNILKRIISLAEALGSSLTAYTDKCLKQLEANAESIRVNLHQKQQAYFFVLRTAGTKTASACLNSLTA